MRTVFEALGLEPIVRDAARCIEYYASSGFFTLLMIGTLAIYALLFIQHAMRLLPTKVRQASEVIGPFWQAAVIGFLISNVHVRMIILGW